MRATCIDLTGDRATVVITPSWPARIFGAREVVVELERRSDDWRAVGSRRPLSHLEHAELIREALDFRPRAQLLAARSVAR